MVAYEGRQKKFSRYLFQKKVLNNIPKRHNCIFFLSFSLFSAWNPNYVLNNGRMFFWPLNYIFFTIFCSLALYVSRHLFYCSQDIFLSQYYGKIWIIYYLTLCVWQNMITENAHMVLIKMYSPEISTIEQNAIFIEVTIHIPLCNVYYISQRHITIYFHPKVKIAPEMTFHFSLFHSVIFLYVVWFLVDCVSLIDFFMFMDPGTSTYNITKIYEPLLYYLFMHCSWWR